MGKAVNLPDIIRNDTDNMLRTQACDSGVLLFVPTPDHTCFGERPHPDNVRPGSVWQCEICLRMFQRSRNKWDGHADGPNGRHSKKFYWRPITSRKAAKLAKIVLESFQGAATKKLEIDAANVYRKHEAVAKTQPQLTAGSLKGDPKKPVYATKSADEDYGEVDTDIADAEIMTPKEIKLAEMRKYYSNLMRKQSNMDEDEEFTTSQLAVIEQSANKWMQTNYKGNF